MSKKTVINITLLLTCILLVISLIIMSKKSKKFEEYTNKNLVNNIINYNSEFESLLLELEESKKMENNKFRYGIISSRVIGIEYLYDFVVNIDEITMKQDLSKEDINLLNKINIELKIISEYITEEYSAEPNRKNFNQDIRNNDNVIKISYLKINSLFKQKKN